MLFIGHHSLLGDQGTKELMMSMMTRGGEDLLGVALEHEEK